MTAAAAKTNVINQAQPMPIKIIIIIITALVWWVYLDFLAEI